MRRLFAVLLVLLSAAAAAQKAPSQLFAEDPRLSARVHLHVEGESVETLLDRLSRVTGVSLTAAREAADDKVVVLGPDRSVREVMADLAALLNDGWTAGPPRDGKPAYVLTRGAAARKYDAGLIREEDRRLAAALDAQVRALSETPEQLARRPEQDWTRRLLAEPELRLGTELYAQLTPRQRDALFEQRRLAFPFASLPMALRERLSQEYAERYAGFERFRAEMPPAASGAAPRPFVDRPEDLARGSLRFRVQRSGGRCFVAVGLGLLPFRASIDALDDGRHALSVPLGFWPVAVLERSSGWLLPAHGDPYRPEAGEPVPGVAVKDVQSAAHEEAFIDQLSRLAETSGKPVLADYYRVPPVAMGAGPTGEAGRLTEALDALCARPGYLWWTRGATLLFRKRDWYEQQRYEVPDRWLRATARAIALRNETLTHGDLYRVLELTPRQLSGLASLGAEAYTGDEDGYLGLPELVALLKAAPGSTPRPLPVAPLSQAAEQQITLGAARLNAEQRRQLAAFVQTRDYGVSDADIAAFGVRAVGRAEPRSSSNGYRALGATIEWSLGGEGMPMTVWLPVALPDDRQARTRVDRPGN